LKEFKQLAGQTLIYGLGTMLPRFLNYILLTVYFTNTLFNDYISEYGKVTELYAYIAFLMVVLTYGMETTYFRYATKIKDRNRVFSSIQTLMFTTTIIFLGSILIFTQPIADALKYSGESYFIRLLALILSVETLSAIPFAKLRIENRPRKFAILKNNSGEH
jgi:O-antigen/teichoic acid export membrane protein